MNTNLFNKQWGYGVLIGLVVLSLGLMVWIETGRSYCPESITLSDAELTQMGLAPLQAASLTVAKGQSISSASQKTLKPVQPSRPKQVLKTASVPFKLARSPYPMPGEKFKKPLKPKLLAADKGVGFAAGGQLQAKPGQIISWNHARQYVGQTITIEGKVVTARRTKKVCFLNFSENWRGRFYVIIFKDALDSWSQSPEKYFNNQTIRVTGKIKKRRGATQIQVTDKAQIQIVN